MMKVSLRPWMLPPGCTLLTLNRASASRVSARSTITSRGTTLTVCGRSRSAVSVLVAVALRVAR